MCTEHNQLINIKSIQSINIKVRIKNEMLLFYQFSEKDDNVFNNYLHLILLQPSCLYLSVFSFHHLQTVNK